MHALAIDRYSGLDSPVHRLPAGIKLAGVILFAALIALGAPSVPGYAAALVLLLVLAAATRIPPGFLLRKLLTLEPFVLVASILTLLQPDGLRVFAVTLTRSTLCLFAMILFAGTTPFTDLLALWTRLRLPPALGTTLALTYRYLFVLTDEAARMNRARRARDYTGRRDFAWHTGAALLARLFARSVARADRIHAAMCARGWRT